MRERELLLCGARPVNLAGPDGSVGEPIDILIADGRIRARGPAADVALFAGGDTEIVDLDGRFVLPGLWDFHVHFGQWAASRQRLDLSSAKDARSAAELVAAQLAAAPGIPVIGYGFRIALWPEEPHRELLDAIAPDTPVFLASGDLHCGWYNAAALEMVGFAGHPTGLLRERDFGKAHLAMPKLAEDELDQAVHREAAAAAARGVVGIVELEYDWNLTTWSRRVRAGNRSLRVECAVYPEHLDDAIGRGVRTGDILEGTDGLLEMGRLKVLTDGSLNTKTAYCHDAYPGTADRGELVVPPEELVPLMRKAAANGIDAAIHAIGDEANKLVLDAFETVGCRGSVEHAQLLLDSDLRRFADLGVVASVQPQHAMDDRDVADRLWAGRTGRAFAFGALLAAGAELALGSDAPVAPLDPWISAAAAVFRTDDDRPAWHPEQQIPVAAALAASTRGRRRLRVGDTADVVVTDQNPLDASSVGELREQPVFGTLLGGRWTYDPR